MAEAYTKYILKDYNLDLAVQSAGTNAKPGLPPTENTAKILKSHGIPCADYRSKSCTNSLVDNADLIFVMENIHKQTLLEQYPQAGNKIYRVADFCPDLEPWIREMGIPDPLGLAMFFYENVYEMIERSCTSILKVFAGTSTELIH